MIYPIILYYMRLQQKESQGAIHVYVKPFLSHNTNDTFNLDRHKVKDCSTALF